MKLEQAARALLAHWDTPIWKDVKPTADLMADLREALAEQAEQDLDTCPGCGGVADNGHDREFPPNPYYCTKCTEQAEQEPVAWTYTRKGIYDKLTELGASITKSCCNVPDKRCGADEWVLQTVQIELLLDALPAPVRTKDLTDDEIVNAAGIGAASEGSIMRFRAVIATDREKNK